MIPGKHCKRFLERGKDVLPELMKDKAKGEKLGMIADLFHVVIKVLNTNKRIDLDLYKRLCHIIGIQIISHFPWAVMGETVHSVSMQYPLYL